MKGKRTVEGAALVDGGRRVGSVLVVCALLMLVGFLTAFAPETLALEASTQERYEEAMAELDEAIRLNPEHVMAAESKERLGAEHP